MFRWEIWDFFHHFVNQDYLEFKSVTNDQEFIDGIENDVSLGDNEVLQLEQSLWMDVMSSNESGGLINSLIL